ncbi:MAG TPA: hypothetical protein VNO75_00895 [Gemmatimonadaceae bacterium]|nr:hypothetical protein [Gemmatimonadaceae bacterium]
MSLPVLFRLGLGLGILASTAVPAASQRLDALSVGVQDSAVPVRTLARADAASGFIFGLRSVGSASIGAVALGTIGFLIDGQLCKMRHGDEPDPVGFFGPCFLYAGLGTTAGWFGGTVAGATTGVARMARKRGCPSREATVRAFAGATVGVLPGLFIVARRPDKYPPGHSALMIGAPVLAGVGAALAVANCRGS